MRNLANILVLVLLMTGCQGDTKGAEEQGDVVNDVVSDLVSSEDVGPTCPAGQVESASGACEPKGIQGCAPMFINEETGLCDPKPEDCPPGHIPIFSEGCQQAGITDCHPDFVNSETGMCDPRPEDCPPTHIPVFSEGCVPVGITDCHPDFVDPQTGICEPEAGDCPPGTLPVLSEGCVPSGVTSCVAEFVNPDNGLCEPNLDSCLPGWIPVLSEGCVPTGVTDCHPDFSDGETGLCDPDPDACGQDAIPVGVEGCVSLDPPNGCGTGTWGLVEQEPGDVHVDPSYTSDASDGSRTHPWVSITEALTMVSSGDRIVLAAGTYDEGVTLGQSVHLAGRCSSMVTLSGTQESDFGPAVLQISGDVEVMLDDLTLSGAGIGLSVSGGATVDLQRVRISKSVGAGLHGSGAGTKINAQVLRVAGTEPREDGSGGEGVRLEAGASLSMERGLVDGNIRYGAHLQTDGLVSFEDVIVSRTELDPEEIPGAGVWLDGGATMSLVRVNLVDNASRGLYVAGLKTSVSASDLVSARTKSSPVSGRGAGVVLVYGASMSLQRASILSNRQVGVAVETGDSSLVAEAVRIEGTTPSETGLLGHGLAVSLGASVTLAKAAVVANAGAGMVAMAKWGTDMPSSLVATDVLVADTQPYADGSGGSGVISIDEATVELTRAALVENRGVGLDAHDGAQVHALDLLVARTKSSPDSTGGLGVRATDEAEIHLERAQIVDNQERGLMAHSYGSLITAKDTVVTGTRNKLDGPGGIGVRALNLGAIELERVWVVDNDSVAMKASDPGTSVSAKDLIITSSQDKPRLGVLIDLGASLTLERAHIVNRRQVALGAFGKGTHVSASDVTVARMKSFGETNLVWGALFATAGARLDLVRANVFDSTEVSLSAGGPGTIVSLQDVRIDRTHPRPDGEYGVGVVVIQGASMIIEGASLSQHHEWGIGVQNTGGRGGRSIPDQGTSLSATDLLVADIMIGTSGDLGGGVWTDPECELTLHRVSLVDNYGYGLRATGTGAHVNATELHVARTIFANHTDGGHGFVVTTGATAVVEQAAILESTGVNVLADGAGSQFTGARLLLASNPSMDDSLFRRGAHVQMSASLSITKTAILDQAGAAIYFFNAGGDITETLVSGTTMGPGTQIGDGIIVDGSLVDLHDTVIRGNARAGLLFELSDGDVSQCLVTDNQFGLVVHGHAGAQDLNDSWIDGNDTNVNQDSQLGIPDEPINVPPPPKLD